MNTPNITKEREVYATPGPIGTAVASTTPRTDALITEKLMPITRTMVLATMAADNGMIYELLLEHANALERENAALRAEKEVEITRGEGWCRDFIAMRKERDALAARVAKLTAALEKVLEWDNAQSDHEIEDVIYQARAALNPPATTQAG